MFEVRAVCQLRKFFRQIAIALEINLEITLTVASNAPRIKGKNSTQETNGKGEEKKNHKSQ
jgi:hypothetical protein